MSMNSSSTRVVGRRRVPDLTTVGSAQRLAGGDQVPFRELLIDLHRGSRKRSQNNPENTWKPPAGRGLPGVLGIILRAFPAASVEINEQLAERDLVPTRKTLRGTHRGEIWDSPPTDNPGGAGVHRHLRVKDGKLIEHWTSMDLASLREQMRRHEYRCSAGRRK